MTPFPYSTSERKTLLFYNYFWDVNWIGTEQLLSFNKISLYLCHRDLNYDLRWNELIVKGDKKIHHMLFFTSHDLILHANTNFEDDYVENIQCEVTILNHPNWNSCLAWTIAWILEESSLSFPLLGICQHSRHSLNPESRL